MSYNCDLKGLVNHIKSRAIACHVLETYQMEVRIDKDIFLDGVQKIQGIAEAKGAMPILSHFLLVAEKDRIGIQATDLEIGSKGYYPANVITSGETTLSAKKIFDILRELPREEVHLIKEDNHWVRLKCGKSKFRLPGMPSEDFPPLPEFSQDSLMELSGKLLKQMIRKTFFAQSPDETRQVLNGLLLEQDNGKVKMVGTDGHRLAVVKRDLGGSSKGEKGSYLIPKKTLAELVKLVEDEEAIFSFSAKNNHFAFIQGDQVIVSRKIDGKFPNYIQVIPKNNQKKLEIDLKLFLDSVDRVASVSLDKKDGVKFNLSKDVLNLSVNNTNSGDGKESLNVKFDHDLEISFNSRYLIDVASQLDGDRIEIFFNDTGSPALIKDPGDFDSIFVVMPMKG